MSNYSEETITVDKYFKFLSEKKLMASECPSCGELTLPPRRLCPKCQSEMKWKQLSGKGTLQTFTAIYVGAKVMTDKGYNRTHPYIFAIAKMDEGPMVSGQLVGVDESKHEEIDINMPIQVTYLSTEIGHNKDGSVKMRWDVGFEPRKN